jgi:hypothetical protein
MKIIVHVDRVVLDGLAKVPPGTRGRIADAMQSGLVRLYHAQSFASLTRRDRAIDRVRAGSIPSGIADPGAAIGSRLAGVVATAASSIRP